MIAEPFLSSTCSVVALCPVELFLLLGLFR